MTGWQPIETAPKHHEGSYLVWCPERHNTYIVVTNEDGRRIVFGGTGRVLEQEPTHWMPLPDPPEVV